MRLKPFFVLFLSLFFTSPAIAGETVEQLYRRLIQAQTRGDYREAIEIVDRIIELEPLNSNRDLMRLRRYYQKCVNGIIWCPRGTSRYPEELDGSDAPSDSFHH
ncbi:MAG: hypothetical protein QNJ54_34340 [Prochloraceae cyanobacterium]|nr:hypothetical protein [Prochloraceae cyanobacterium]